MMNCRSLSQCLTLLIDTHVFTKAIPFAIVRPVQNNDAARVIFATFARDFALFTCTFEAKIKNR